MVCKTLLVNRSIIYSTFSLLSDILSVITYFLFTSHFTSLSIFFHIIYIYCFEFAYISSVMTDEISFIMKLYSSSQNGYKS